MSFNSSSRNRFFLLKIKFVIATIELLAAFIVITTIKLLTTFIVIIIFELLTTFIINLPKQVQRT
jgi:hypothetical protein